MYKVNSEMCWTHRMAFKAIRSVNVDNVNLSVLCFVKLNKNKFEK